MSADNLVYALPYKKLTGEIVWRVAQVYLSGLAWDVCYMMSTKSRVKRFQEFAGPEAARQAHAAAYELERRLPVFEYGVTVLATDQEPLTMAKLQQDAIEAGYDSEDVHQLQEASDDDWAQKEVEHWGAM